MLEIRACCICGTSTHRIEIAICRKPSPNRSDQHRRHVRTGRPARRRTATRNINHAPHTKTAMRQAVVLISARPCEGVRINKALFFKIPWKQLVSLGEQYCESAAQGGPLVTLWPPPAQVHRTVSPTEMLT